MQREYSLGRSSINLTATRRRGEEKEARSCTGRTFRSSGVLLCGRCGGNAPLWLCRAARISPPAIAASNASITIVSGSPAPVIPEGGHASDGVGGAETDTDLWFWDFTSSCQPAKQYTYQVPGRSDKQTYNFQICGTATTTCPGNIFPQGAVIQTWTTAQGLACETLGEGAPLYLPWPTTPGVPSPGINVTFQGTPYWNGE
jgi:hypothetical protein